MSALEVQIPLFERADREAVRRETRETLVRRVSYCRFPRVCADQRMRVAFTLDVSPSGLCLHGAESEPVGALLRVSMHGLDGCPEPEQLARVAWTASEAGDAHRMGLELLGSGASRPLRIRYLRSS